VAVAADKRKVIDDPGIDAVRIWQRGPVRPV